MVDSESELRRTALESARCKRVMAHALDGIIGIVRNSARAITGADRVTFILGEGRRCHDVDEDAIAPSWKARNSP